MNAIESLEYHYDSSIIKSHKGKIMSGARERATKRYFKDAATRSRRKQGKTNYDTFRRYDQPDEEDTQLENIHYANFLGLKDIAYRVQYNNKCIDEQININECDILLPYECEEGSLDSITSSEDEEYMRAEEENFEAMVAYMRQQVELAQQMVEHELYVCDCKCK
jgi:hypothetical protein